MWARGNYQQRAGRILFAWTPQCVKQPHATCHAEASQIRDLLPTVGGPKRGREDEFSELPICQQWAANLERHAKLGLKPETLSSNCRLSGATFARPSGPSSEKTAKRLTKSKTRIDWTRRLANSPAIGIAGLAARQTSQNKQRGIQEARFNNQL